MTSIIEQWSGYLSVALIVLLAFQQWRLFQLRKKTVQREELFRVVAENAADMIALVDVKGKRLYNSPAYEKVLGYTPEELEKTSAFEQIHPEDRYKVLEASREAKATGIGKNLEYRIKHKNGEWRILESAASTIRGADGEVEKLVIVNRDITDRKHTEKLLEHNSFHDGVTGLPNRRLLIDRLQRSSVRAQRHPDYQFAILLIDIDNFKHINNTFGQTAGDQVMMELGGRLASCLRHHDTVARPGNQIPSNDAVLSRMGGDEFTVLLEGITDSTDALRVARRVQASISGSFMVGTQELPISASIGIALSTDEHERAEDLLQCSDIAVHRAKALGGARCELFNETMHTRAENRLKLEAELRTAIDNRQFHLCYQPILNLNTQEAVGFEALVRWHHPEQGVVSPSKFIEVAERAGLMVQIGKWVIGEACRQLHAWQTAYPAFKDLSITVNISAKQLAHADLRDDLKRAIQENRLNPSSLHIELTEADAEANPKLTTNLFDQLKHLGVVLSLGDFGTGHSSLTWLRRTPLDELKIDRSLVASMPSDQGSHDLVRLTIMLARELDLEVVAEGIETAVHLERLRRLGCEVGQGYLFSKPLEAEQADQLLKQQNGRSNAAGAGK